MNIKNYVINSSTVALIYMGEILFVDVKIANAINKINKEEQNLLRKIRRHEILWSNFNYRFSKTQNLASIVEKEAIINIQIENLQKILNELPSSNVKIFLDKYYHNKTYSEIAKECGIPLSTIYYKINRIKKDVSKKLKN